MKNFVEEIFVLGLSLIIVDIYPGVLTGLLATTLFGLTIINKNKA